MKTTLCSLALILLICAAPAAFAQTNETPIETESEAPSSFFDSMPLSLSLAYAGENIIRAGALVSFNAVPLKNGIHELVVSPSTGFFVFRPYYTSLLLGVRAQYKLNFPFGLGLRVAGITLSYKHKLMLADVYVVEDGEVQSITDIGYGNLHVLATTGLEYDFKDLTDLPFAAFTDFGISAEPYFGVFRFHLELYAGITYHLN